MLHIPHAPGQGSIRAGTDDAPAMRIMEWNLQFGGTHDHLPGIIEAIRRHDPDLLVLLEFRQERVIEICLSLATLNYSYVLNSQPPPRTNGILLASKMPIQAIEGERVRTQRHRWLESSPEGSDLRILAVHLPGASDLPGKMEHWEALMGYAREAVESQQRVVLIGDLGTGLEQDTEGPAYIGREHLSSILSLGWRDVWREYHQMAKEYSWYNSSGKGMRTDHALVSPAIRHPVWATYSHKEREMGLSDHSILILDLMSRMNESGSRSHPLYSSVKDQGCSIG
jgi:exonuclease III